MNGKKPQATMERYHLTPKSRNEKTGAGRMAVSTTSALSCPMSCGQRAVCYAKKGPLSLHWNKVSKGERGVSFSEFLDQLRAIEPGFKFRHNQAGDLPGKNERVNGEKLQRLASASAHLEAYTYTHKKPEVGRNAEYIRKANEAGFTINLSADSLAGADRLASWACGPVVVVVPSDHPERSKTPAGRPVVVCPEQTGKAKSCADCMLCAKSGSARAIVAFREH